MRTELPESTPSTSEMPYPNAELALPDDEPARPGSDPVPVKLSRFLLELYPLAMSSPIGEFEEQLFLLLHEYFAFDSAWLGRSTMLLQGPLMHNSYVHNLAAEFVADWDTVKAADPIVPIVMNSPKKAVVISMADEGIVAHFRKLLAGKYAIARILCAVSKDDPALKLWTHLSLYKNSFLHAFSAEEIQLIELVIPHIASAINLNRVHHIEQLKAAKSSRRVSIAICDSRGVLQYADAAFADLMLMEWPEWKGAMLPRTFRELQQEKNPNLYVGKLISLQAERVSDLLLINAKPRSVIDVLTPRELAVARLYGEGLTYKAVAKQMEISPATVRHHLRQAYAKLRIQNKGEIAWLLSRYEQGARSHAHGDGEDVV
ncbi:MAG: helix-turn-helix transcriptional regulator [Betaproteobacteria bacterium]|nr:helix-turn-helix transcriptional regulator [Betaproteobacteria bacterium]